MNKARMVIEPAAEDPVVIDPFACFEDVEQNQFDELYNDNDDQIQENPMRLLLLNQPKNLLINENSIVFNSKNG